MFLLVLLKYLLFFYIKIYILFVVKKQILSIAHTMKILWDAYYMLNYYDR